jgi:hypothetical protein
MLSTFHRLIVLAVIGVCLVPSPAWGQPAGVKKEDLLYDAAPFDFWKDRLQTELKPERRIEAIQALAAFGVNGYGAEASAIIVDIARTYAPPASFQLKESDMTPDERVAYHAMQGLLKIGTPAAPALLKAVEHPTIFAMAKFALSDLPPYQQEEWAFTIAPETVPLLLQVTKTDKRNLRNEAWVWLADQAFKTEAHKAALLRVLNDETVAREFFARAVQILGNTSEREHSRKSVAYFMMNLGPRANAAPQITTKLESLVPLRTKEVAGLKSENPALVDRLKDIDARQWVQKLTIADPLSVFQTDLSDAAW